MSLQSSPPPPLPAALGDLASAPTADQRLAVLRSTPGLASPESVRTLCERALFLIRADLSAATQTAEAALWLANRTQDPASIALSQRAYANSLLLHGDAEAAHQLYTEAQHTFSSLNDLTEVANTQLNLITLYIQTSRYDDALALSTSVRKLFETLDNPLGIARLETNLGIILFRQERFSEASASWWRAYSTFSELGKSHDVAIALRNLAVCEISLNRFRRAQRIYEQARAFCLSHGLHILVHEIDYNIAYLYFLRGDYNKAIHGYSAARQRSKELGDSYHEALCDLDESELYLDLNLLADAKALASRAISAFTELGKEYETAKALTFQAIVLHRLDSSRESLLLLDKAHTIFRSEGNSSWKALTLLYQGLVLYHEGRYYEARRKAAEALACLEGIDSGSKLGLCLILSARLELIERRSRAAAHLCTRALGHLASPEARAVKLQALLIKAEALEQDGLSDEAFRLIEEAEAVLAQIRIEAPTSDLRIPIIRDRLTIYESLFAAYTSAATGTHTPSRAFEIAEKAKARSLADLLGLRALPAIRTAIPRSRLVDQVQALREELVWFYRRLDRSRLSSVEQGTQSLTRLRHSVLEVEARLETTLSEVRHLDTELGSLHLATGIDLKQVQSLLASNEAIIEYFIAGDVIYAMRIGRTESELQAVSIVPEVRELHRLLKFQLVRLASQDENSQRLRSLPSHNKILARLFEELLSPVLPSAFSYKHLVIVPHGFLSYLPFHAFLRDQRYLCQDFYISSLPSASVLLRRSQADGQETSGTLYFPSRNEPSTVDRSVLPKPVSDPPTDLASALQRAAGRRWQAVHLSLQARFRRDNPVFSVVKLMDKSLNLLDLYRLTLNAAVVVATDCAPPLGTAGTGDEVVALIRGLLSSGASSVLLPIWPGRSEANEMFLRSFYSELSTAGEFTPGIAQAAYNQTRRRFPHPADWANWAAVSVSQPAGPTLD